MIAAEAALLWGSVAAYVAAFGLSVAARIFRSERLERPVGLLFPAAVALHLGAGLARWISAGHAPVQGVYENSLSGAFFLGAIYLGLFLRIPAVRKALPFVALAVVLLIGNGVTVRKPAIPLEPPFRSGWLLLHVGFAWIAFGAYLISGILAGAHLLQRGEGTQKLAALLEDASGRVVVLGFVADTVMIAAGALWADSLWGRYWGWDPIETWSLISWLIYGANLHVRFTLGWRGHRIAWLTLLCVPAIVVTFFGVQFVSDVHTKLL